MLVESEFSHHMGGDGEIRANLTSVVISNKLWKMLFTNFAKVLALNLYLLCD